MATNNSYNMSITTGPNYQVNKPFQPCFAVYLSATVANRTGNNVYNTVPWDREYFDIGDNFSIASNLFTAPVSGVYFFGVYVTYTNLAVSETNNTVAFIKSPGTIVYDSSYSYPYILMTPSKEYTVSNDTIISLSAGETVYVRIIVIGGPQTVGVKGGAGNSMFYGYLLS
jgi:hypothetical protein